MMIQLRGAAGAISAAILAVCAAAGAQAPVYQYPTAAAQAQAPLTASPFGNRGTSSGKRTTLPGAAFGAAKKGLPPAAQTPADVDSAAPGGGKPVSSLQAGVRIEEDIPVNEQPGARAARTAPAENAPPGAVSALNRPVNFPRDPGDDVDILKLQVFLDYHGYSPAEIDGRWGYNTERALYVYQRNNGMQETGQLDDKMLSRLNDFRDGYLMEYTVTREDATGGDHPYRTIPRDYYAQAKLSWLPYESACEALAEKFHCTQTLLHKLNPGVDFDHLQGGERILGLNVIDGIDEKRGQVAVVRVSKYNKWIEAYDAEGRFMFYYPSTLGSEYDPLPLGTWYFINKERNPPFEYKPSLMWDANKNDPVAMIPPGPNCPVGNIWMGTSRKSVGLHGTPNPENISKNTSHGCIRMTNWDANQLYKRIKEGAGGTKLEFVQ